jgi:hypothetical protein
MIRQFVYVYGAMAETDFTISKNEYTQKSEHSQIQISNKLNF